MTIRYFLAATAAATFICFLIWLAISVFFNPDTVVFTVLAIFYLSLFLWLCGFFILFGFFAQYFLKPDALPYPLISMATRQALLASLTIVILLILKGSDALNWINGSFLLIAVIFIESYFLISK